MAIYKHYPSRKHLLEAVVKAEYDLLSEYFKRANDRRDVPGLRGMLGYLDYACENPELFRFMFAAYRPDAAVFPADLAAGKSPTFTVLLEVVHGLVWQGVLKADDVMEVALAIWAHAHGLVSLYIGGRIGGSRKEFESLYMRSLGRLCAGLAEARKKA